MYLTKSVENVENLTTSRWYVGQHVSRIQTSGSEGQSTGKDEPQPMKQEQQDRSFDAVKMKCINLIA